VTAPTTIRASWLKTGFDYETRDVATYLMVNETKIRQGDAFREVWLFDSPGLCVKGQNGSPLDCYLSLDERYERKGNLRRHERHSWSRLYWLLDCHEVSQGKSFSKSMLDMDFEPKIEGENFIDEAILGALEKCPFSSLRQIAKRIFIPMGTVRYHSVNSSGYRIRNILWVPHSLSSSQKQARVEMSQDLLPVLRLAKDHVWKYIVTLDEAWFYFSNHFDRIWLPHDELSPSSPKQTIASQKSMSTVV
jgi:hypothetical protein